MTGSELELSEPVLTGEIIEDEGYLKLVYENLGIEEALASYLDSDDLTENEINILLIQFSISIAAIAGKGGGINIDAVREAFEHLTQNMNELASRKYGYEHQHHDLAQAALIKLKIKEPQPLKPRKYVRALDDRYWSKQFLEQYESESIVSRRPNETEEQYLARYIHSCMHGLLFSYFTYVK